MTIAAIDLGSNSSHTVIAEAGSGDGVPAIAGVRERVRMAVEGRD